MNIFLLLKIWKWQILSKSGVPVRSQPTNVVSLNRNGLWNVHHFLAKNNTFYDEAPTQPHFSPKIIVADQTKTYRTYQQNCEPPHYAPAVKGILDQSLHTHELVDKILLNDYYTLYFLIYGHLKIDHIVTINFTNLNLRKTKELFLFIKSCPSKSDIRKHEN